MLSLRRLFLLLVLVFFGSALAQVQIRVLLSDTDEAVSIRMSGPHRGYVDGLLRFDTPMALSWPLKAQDDRLWVDGEAIGRSLRLEPTDGTFVSWQGRDYRGSLMFLAKDDSIRVINVADIEAYLRGVVPAEMQASWPLEALKAQAVAARSYTMTSLKPEADYDICATVDCQVYRGVAAERPRSDRAVAETAGLVVTYGGKPAKTYYHADSGGYLASSAEVWGASLPYLSARSDVTSDTPYGQWQRRLDPAAMTASLRTYNINIGTVRALRVLAYSESGRVRRAEVIGERGRKVLEGTVLRTLLRSWGLKSTRFSMQSDLTASGAGWGHGVGMSQYGARSLALSSYSFEQILAFYYPSTRLSRLSFRLASQP